MPRFCVLYLMLLGFTFFFAMLAMQIGFVIFLIFLLCLLPWIFKSQNDHQND
jgi:cbb3-type cytochrome oxidase subunit 3